MYRFENILSNIAQNCTKPYSGLPKHHFVGGNIDEATVPLGALSDALVDLLKEEGHHLAKYGMEQWDARLPNAARTNRDYAR